MDNLEKQATLGAQDTKRKQTKQKKPTTQCGLNITMRKQTQIT